MNNGKLVVNNKQRTINNEKSAKKRLFIIALFSVLIFGLLGCDLFTGSKVDLFQVISDEVDWANAAKLTVKLAYPVSWGQGAIKTSDIRKGYEFSVDFAPSTEYTLSSWVAYPTAALDTISGQPGQAGNWLDYPPLIEAERL